MKKLLFYILPLVGLCVACGPKEVPSIGSKSYQVFDKEHLYFDPEINKNGIQVSETDPFYIESGRIMLKKLTIPKFERETKVKITVEETSAGDRWDKSGSVFMMPANGVNMLSVAKKEYELKNSENAEETDSFPGIIAEGEYQPTVELMRFMTPFGVGFYSEQDTSKYPNRMPVYIDGWAKKAVWEQDITHLIPLLEGEIYVGVHIDTWTKEGYNISVRLDFEESENAYEPARKRWVSPVMNTVRYIPPQRGCDQFQRKDVGTTVNVPAGAKTVNIGYITTGHGGHSGGDEFVPTENIIKVDDEIFHSFTPWRTDCASFRRFNPTSGVWLKKRKVDYIDWEKKKYQTKEIEEPEASSDLSRSNWCPGSDVPPLILPMSIGSGEHKITVSMPTSQVQAENEHNFWFVSAYLFGELN
ncbi:PNGase F N-terminal domain-containing protein [Sediminitomix flava]|uniref:Peptide-N-glycosidase F-like protein n=1 Tax=Sediminitomix flava TaxID=379075 RepID=A0A315ZA38_SEDFL|nr:PNGase F N-terminal domain-containing protein [Sediminitomix flava]PWJ42190.1 peptide-N-glycosidase F-like protein [Sediminitomix flava]